MANSNVSTRDTQLEKQRLGYIAISFSNMDATTEPKIQAGSVCEVAGTLYSFTTEESNTGWAGIGNSTQAYLYLDPAADGTSVSAVWTSTAPVWDEAKYGYYASDTSNRYVLRCYKDSSGNYTEKYKYIQDYGNKYDAGNNEFTGDNKINASEITGLTYGDIGTYVIAASTSWSTSTEYLPGTTVSGSTLVRDGDNTPGTFGIPLNIGGPEVIVVLSTSEVNLGLSGTWTLMTRVYRGNDSNYRPVGLFLRTA